jgi:hypothetical protein
LFVKPFLIANNPIFIVGVLNVDCYRKFRWRHPNVFMDINEDILKKHPYYRSKLIPPYNKDFWNEPALEILEILLYVGSRVPHQLVFVPSL